MTNNMLFQIVSVLILAIAGFFLINPLHLWMPDDVHMLTLAGVVIVAGIFAAFVLAENRGDEREVAHRALAGRFAFFSGAIVLIVAITIQTFEHALDPWLVYALIAMIAGKVAARCFAAISR